MLSITFASHNAGKIREMNALAQGLAFPLAFIPVPKHVRPVEETGQTFLDNARLKAQSLLHQAKTDLIVAEDSGLIIPVLNSTLGLSPFPGIASNRWMTCEVRNQLLNVPQRDESVSDTDRNDGILALMTSHTQRKAYYHCSMVLFSQQTGFLFEAEGQMNLEVIQEEARGTAGFGYDPIMKALEANNPEKTAAELSMTEKNQLSHRAHAFHQLVQYLRTASF